MSTSHPSLEIEFVECPRDAMQGWKQFIPTETKAAYINKLLEVGFHTIDFGSFVSPKAIPQMADTRAVVPMLRPAAGGSKLLAIVANARGAEEAAEFDEINVLGFPFSISPTFQLRNTNSTMEESLVRVEEIIAIANRKNKELVIYLSMGFGNPYGDAYSEEELLRWADGMFERGIQTISLADTVGLAEARAVQTAVATLVRQYPDRTIGVHLHSTPMNWEEKLAAAVNGGTQRVDGAVAGIGGCPMAGDELVGNMDTLVMIPYLQKRGALSSINNDALMEAGEMAKRIFI